MALAAALGEQRVRRGAAVTYSVPGGSISYYESKGAFKAVCENRAHGRCVLTRTCKSRGVLPNGGPRGGRPVGFLAAWLGRAEASQDKAGHWIPEAFANSVEVRSGLRAQIANTPSGVRLLAHERPVEPGEAAEPESLEGYL